MVNNLFIKAVTEMVYIIIYKIFAFGKGDVGVDFASVTLETEG